MDDLTARVVALEQVVGSLMGQNLALQAAVRTAFIALDADGQAKWLSRFMGEAERLRTTLLNAVLPDSAMDGFERARDAIMPPDTAR